MSINTIIEAIHKRDVSTILRLMFSEDGSQLNDGFKTENNVWDFKENIPKPEKSKKLPWARIAKHVLAFYNSGGGILIFGIHDKSYCVQKTKELVDSKQFNDQIRKYINDRIYVEYNRCFIDADQRYVGIAIIPPRGPLLESFIRDAPEDEKGDIAFARGMSAIRENDSTKILSSSELEAIKRRDRTLTMGNIYTIDEPFFRVLTPDYDKFIPREACKKILEGLRDRRTSIVSITGIGGIGKTALATWAVLEAYESGLFEFIISTTAKDRELTSTGILGIQQTLNSYDALLNSILDVLGESSTKNEQTKGKESTVLELISESNGLLFVDNLETVDDSRIFSFLDHLPYGVKAITTSRRAKVRVSVFPVDVGPMKNQEMFNYIQSLSVKNGLSYLGAIDKTTSGKICTNISGIPLALRWLASRCDSGAELVSQTEAIRNSGRQGEELLEFSYRRIFEDLTSSEKSILNVLSIFNEPIPEEMILVGSSLSRTHVQDEIGPLVEDSLVQRIFDADRNDYVYSLLPITRSFIYSELLKQRGEEQKIRSKLTNFFEATDISSPEERNIIRLLRQGSHSSEAPLIDLARVAKDQGDFPSAEELLKKALARNSRSWKAAKLLAELYRDNLDSTTKAIQYYQQALVNAPSRGEDRMLIFRELGLLLRDSGKIGCKDEAITYFLEALKQKPNDSITLNALCRIYEERGNSGLIITMLVGVVDGISSNDAHYLLPLLSTAYQKTGEMIKAAEIKAKLDKMKNTFLSKR